MDEEPLSGDLLPATSPQADDHLPEPVDPIAAVLAAFDQAATKHLADIRPGKTKTSYARDWALWLEFLDWSGERLEHRVADTDVTKGTLVAFVVWLDQVKQAAPNSIDRRITGVTVTARSLGVEVPKEATVGARKALKPLKLDPVRQARGRGKAIAASPENLRTMSTAILEPRPGSRKRHVPPAVALLRDRALVSMAFGIGGRVSEVSALTIEAVTLEGEGLRVVVPSVKGRPSRTVPVAFGEHAATCPVRCWLAWKEATGRTKGPAFVSVSETGVLGEHRLSPDGCRIAITRAAARSGIEARLTGHSMRAGLVTTARKKGKRVEKIRAQTGHAINSPVFWEYVREGELWEDAATDGIGL